MGKLVLLNHFEEGDRQVAVHGQVVGDILNFNEEQRKYSDENWRMADPDMKPVARIPRVVWMKLKAMGIAQDEGLLLRWLAKNPQWMRTEKRLI